MIAVLLFFVFTILHKFYIDVKKSCHFYICFFVRSLSTIAIFKLSFRFFCFPFRENDLINKKEYHHGYTTI